MPIEIRGPSPSPGNRTEAPSIDGPKSGAPGPAMQRRGAVSADEAPSARSADPLNPPEQFVMQEVLRSFTTMEVQTRGGALGRVEEERRGLFDRAAYRMVGNDGVLIGRAERLSMLSGGLAISDSQGRPVASIVSRGIPFGHRRDYAIQDAQGRDVGRIEQRASDWGRTVELRFFAGQKPVARFTRHGRLGDSTRYDLIADTWESSVSPGQQLDPRIFYFAVAQKSRIDNRDARNGRSSDD